MPGFSKSAHTRVPSGLLAQHDDAARPGLAITAIIAIMASTTREDQRELPAVIDSLRLAGPAALEMLSVRDDSMSACRLFRATWILWSPLFSFTLPSHRFRPHLTPHSSQRLT